MALAAQGFGAWLLRRKMTCKRKQIQQTLTGVAVEAITAIEHCDSLTSGVERFGQLLRHSGGAMPYHQQLGPHGHIGAHGVQQAFPFAQ